MNAKHQFKYTFNETNLEEFSPVDITMEIPGDVTLTQMLYNFERYLQAAGFVFDGKLDFVEDTYPEYLDDIAEEESTYGCMADFDKECGCESTSSPLEKWNKDIAKLDNELKTQREIREKASKSADMVKDFNDAYEKLTHEQKMKCYQEALQMCEPPSKRKFDSEVKKNKWVHGICNPPSPDWKASNKSYDGAASANSKLYSEWLNKNK